MDGVEVPKNQPVAAPDMPADLFAGLTLLVAQKSLLLLLKLIGLFLKLGFDRLKLLGGRVDNPQQHSPRSRLVHGCERGSVPPLQSLLVNRKPIFVNLAPEFLEGVLKLRLEHVAREKHAGDLGFTDRVDRLVAHQANHFHFLM